MDFFEFSCDALYPSFNHELVIVQQPLETADYILSEAPAEEISQSQTERNFNNVNSAEFAMEENIARVHQVSVPHPVTSVASYHSNGWVSDSDIVTGSISNQREITEIPINYLPQYNDTVSFNTATQEIRSVNSNNNTTWMQHLQNYPASTSQSTPKNINNRLGRSRNDPYSRGTPSSISHQARTHEKNVTILPQSRVTFSNPADFDASSLSGIFLAHESQQRQENFEFVNSMPDNMLRGQQSGQGTTPAATIVNDLVGETIMETAYNTSQYLTNAIQPQVQILATDSEQPKLILDSRFVNNQSTTQSGLMNGDSMVVSSSAVLNDLSAVEAMQNQSNSQQYNVSSHDETSPSNIYFELEEWLTEMGRSSSNQLSHSSSISSLPLDISNVAQDINNRGCLAGMTNSEAKPAITAVFQLAAARQLIVQAARSSAAAGENGLSQALKDRIHSLDRLMNADAHPSFLHDRRTQNKAFLSLTDSANSKISAPLIPTCSICLDKLVSTILFPCRHFFCETCAPKIKKCGLCREFIKKRHRVYLF